jgi:hypothetical protein
VTRSREYRDMLSISLDFEPLKETSFHASAQPFVGKLQTLIAPTK